MHSLLILFDIDGTLLLTKGAGRAATRAAMLRVFGTCGKVDTHEFSGKTDWFTLVELLGAEGFKENDIAHRIPAYEREMAHFLENFIGNYTVNACVGALPLVQRLRKTPHIHLGVITGNVNAVAPIKLRAAGFAPDWFPIGAYGNESIDRNLLPALALGRANRYYNHIFRPSEVIIVGDTPMDIACARALGAVAVAVATGTVSYDDLAAAAPDYLLRDLTSFESVVLDNLHHAA
ncbi:MAG: HAD hydrolase-like protein [Chloroflexi bacterium]|nr:HAD hydrolase-like protein [Chloroflexota bacterium]